MFNIQIDINFKATFYFFIPEVVPFFSQIFKNIHIYLFNFALEIVRGEPLTFFITLWENCF